MPRTHRTMAEEQKNEVASEEPAAPVTGDQAIDQVFKDFVDHQKKALDEARLALEGLIPVAVKDHGKAAVEEVIEGYRTLFNALVDSVNDRVQKIRVPAEKSDESSETIG